MKFPSLRLPFLLLIALCADARAAFPPVLRFPPDLALSTQSSIRVLAFRKEGQEPVHVTVNGKPAGMLEGGNFLKGEAALTPGMNLLSLGGKPVRVYYKADASGGQFSPGGGKGKGKGKEKGTLLFRTYALHPAMDDGCEGCHVLKGGKLEAKNQKEACYACHDDFGKGGDPKRYLHEPVASGECTSCHDPHYSTAPKLQKGGKGCLECHDHPLTKGFAHAPVRDGKCTQCHDPHVGVAPKQLVLKANDLCGKCHRNIHRNHRSATVHGGMTVLPADVRKEGDQLSCLNCHLPHQSPNRKLLVKPSPELCNACHQGV